jgi:hypothetical protein
MPFSRPEGRPSATGAEARLLVARGQRLDAISGMLVLDVALFEARVAATLGLPLGGLIAGAALFLALMRWSERPPAVGRLHVKLAA